MRTRLIIAAILTLFAAILSLFMAYTLPDHRTKYILWGVFWSLITGLLISKFIVDDTVKIKGKRYPKYPGHEYQELFVHMAREHKRILLQSEMDEIIRICKKIK